jgi:hypothetical protein
MTATTWAVVLGWNHADDTIECLRSLVASEGVALRLLYVDNGSEEAEVRKVEAAVPEALVVRHPVNVGVSRGFNAGFAYALQHGAEHVVIANNDTIFAPAAVGGLLAAAHAFPDAGLFVPRINYHGAPDITWSAGSRFRRFPPSIVMRSTRGERNPRYREPETLAFSTLCTVLVRGRTFRDAGLMNPNFVYYYEDYEFCQRIRDAGHGIRYVPSVTTWHKVERVTRAGKASPAFWSNYGRSTALFRRIHGPRHPWVAGPMHVGYVAARALVEGGPACLLRFREGYRTGRLAEILPVPTWDGTGVDAVEVLRGMPS